MPPKIKTEKEKQALKALIIDAARELFVSKGVQAVSMREIAKRIGYSATSIYSHFTDKEAVLRAVCDTDFMALNNALNSIIKIEDPVERMVVLGKVYADFALNYPNHYRLMFMHPHLAHSTDGLCSEEHNAEQCAYLQLKNVVNAVYEAGRFRQELTDVDLIAQTIWAGMHGVCSLQIAMAQDDWFQWSDITDRVELMQDVLLRGLIRK